VLTKIVAVVWVVNIWGGFGLSI